MRKFLSSLVIAGAAVVALDAQEKKADEKPAEKKAAEVKKAEEKQPAKARAKVEVTLKVGDAPPELKADKWLQGTEVKSFEKGKVYIVEFWATWCGPCIVMMPHMSELQAEFKDKGLTIIGYTKQDQNNSEEKVKEFVKKRGPKLGYTFAYSAEPDVYESWMRASGQNGIPCCFVVDKQTKIAYIGHPMYLDVILPKVMEGKWTKDDQENMANVEQDANAVFVAVRNPNPEVGLKALADFEAKYPILNKIPYFVSPKLNLLLKAKKYDDLKVVAKNLIARAKKVSDETLLGQVAGALRGPDAKDQKELLQISVQAAQEVLAMAGDKDVRALLSVAQSHFAAGDKAKGKEFAKKTLDAAETPMKTSVGTALIPSFFEAGEKAAGLEWAEQIIKAAPSQMRGSIQTQVVTALLKTGDKATAEEHAKKAIEAATENGKPGVQAMLAGAYLRSGDKKTGANYAKQAIEGASEEVKPTIHYQLAQAFYATGDKPTARDHATKAIENSSGMLQTQLRRLLKPILDDPAGKSGDN